MVFVIDEIGQFVSRDVQRMLKLRLRSAAGRDDAKAAVMRVTGELAELAKSIPPHRQMANRQRRTNSHLQRGYGWDRARTDITAGSRIWTGYGVFAHNLLKISAHAA